MDAGADLKAAWRKSTYSADQGNCVEIGRKFLGSVVIRDSKRVNGLELAFSVVVWGEFVRQVRNGRH